MTPYQYSFEEQHRRFPLWGFLLPFIVVIVAVIASESAKSALVQDLKAIPQPKAADPRLMTRVSDEAHEGFEPMMPAPSAVVFPDESPRVVIVERKAVPAKTPVSKPVVNDFDNQAPQINAENADSQIVITPYYEPKLSADYTMEAEYQPPASAPMPTEAPVQNPGQKADIREQTPAAVMRASALTRQSPASNESPAAPASSGASSAGGVIPVPEPEPAKANFGFTSASPQTASASESAANSAGY